MYPSHMGGDTLLSGQYIYEYTPGHRLANSWGWVAQHRLIAETMLGRPLVRATDREDTEVVHHIDHNPLNNSPSNLQVLTHRAHRKLHARYNADKALARLTADMVQTALIGRTIKQAAEALRVNHQTLRNRFPEILAPRKRRAPADVRDLKWPEVLRPYAEDPAWTLAATVRAVGLSAPVVQRICRENGIPWRANKSGGRTGRPKGSKNRHPRKKPTPPV